MRILHDAHDHYTEEDGYTRHSFIRISKTEKIFVRDLIAIARAVGAAAMSRTYFAERHSQKGHACTGYLHEEEIFFISIKGVEKKCAYTLCELYQALGRESTSYPSP